MKSHFKVYVIGPLWVAKLYQLLNANNLSTSFCWVALAVLGYILPELMHLSWSTEEMNNTGGQKK